LAVQPVEGGGIGVEKKRETCKSKERKDRKKLEVKKLEVKKLTL
jgi:hypothetical protein